MVQSTDNPVLHRRISTIVFALLLVAALAAAAGIVGTISNYRRSVAALDGLQLEFTSLEMIEGDDDDLTAVVRQRLRNDSPVSIWVAGYEFMLYANDERVGSSSSSYQGAGAESTYRERRQARLIQQELAPGEHVDLEFTVPIYHTQMESLRGEQNKGPVTWESRAGFTVKLPTARREEMAGLSATLEVE